MSNPTMRFAVRGEGSDTLEIDVYDDIGASFWGDGVTAKGVRRLLKASPKTKSIRLRINSRGGDVFDAVAIHSLLVDHAATVEADVDGLAASAASLILMAAETIRIAPGAMIMIHNPWAFAMGEAEDLRGRADLLDKVRDELANIYSARTNLDRERVLEMMTAETWLTPAEALEHGFADEVKHDGEADARALAALDLRGLERVPQGFLMAVATAREIAPPHVPEPAPPAPAPTAAPPTPNLCVVSGTGPVATPDPSVERGEQQENRMDMRTLRAQHPDLFDEAVQVGVTQERDRVCAHLEFGEKSGALPTAFTAIREGEAMTQTMQAKYMTAGMNRADQRARQTETDEASEVLEGAPKTSDNNDEEDLGAQVVAILNERRGKAG